MCDSVNHKIFSEKERENNFKTLLEFRGWGNPKNSIWFVGIEEGGDWSFCSFYNSRKKQDCGIDYYREMCFRDDFEKALRKYELDKNGLKYFEWMDEEKDQYFPLWDNISRLCCKIFEIDEKRYRDFRHELLCKNVNDVLPKSSFENYKYISNIFLTNLYPLGVKDTTTRAWNNSISEYVDYFDLNEEIRNKEDYYKLCKNRRFKIYKDNCPKILICLGMDWVKDFEECFGITNFENKGENRYYCYKGNFENTLCLIRHLSRAIPDYYSNEIIKEISNWSKNHPFAIH